MSTPLYSFQKYALLRLGSCAGAAVRAAVVCLKCGSKMCRKACPFVLEVRVALLRGLCYLSPLVDSKVDRCAALWAALLRGSALGESLLGMSILGMPPAWQPASPSTPHLAPSACAFAVAEAVASLPHRERERGASPCVRNVTLNVFLAPGYTRICVICS